MTNRELITSVLRMLSVLDSNETASSEDAILGLAELNATMSYLASKTIDLGYPPQDDVSDDFPLSDSEAEQIKPIFAMRLSIYYPSRQPPQWLPVLASSNESQLLLNTVLSNIEEASLSNLPRGNGQCWRGDIINGD
jgi:hypothetical protein